MKTQKLNMKKYIQQLEEENKRLKTNINFLNFEKGTIINQLKKSLYEKEQLRQRVAYLTIFVK